MTISTQESARPRISYYCVDDADDDRAEVESPKETSAAPVRYYLQEREPRRKPSVTSFGRRWRHPDTVPELLDELVTSGRRREAAAIRRVLGHDDDETAMRAYVSRLWAKDWDSAEDSVYDE